MAWFAKFLLGGASGAVLSAAIAIPVVHYAEQGGLPAVGADLRGAGSAVRSALVPMAASEPQHATAEELQALQRARQQAAARMAALQNEQRQKSGSVQGMFETHAVTLEDLKALKPYADRVLAQQEANGGMPMGLSTMSNPAAMMPSTGMIEGILGTSLGNASAGATPKRMAVPGAQPSGGRQPVQVPAINPHDPAALQAALSQMPGGAAGGVDPNMLAGLMGQMPGGAAGGFDPGALANMVGQVQGGADGQLNGMNPQALMALLGQMQLGAAGGGGVNPAMGNQILSGAVTAACDPAKIRQLSARGRALKTTECRKMQTMIQTMQSGGQGSGFDIDSVVGLDLSTVSSLVDQDISVRCAQNPPSSMSPEGRAQRARLCKSILNGANPKATRSESSGFDLPFGLSDLFPGN